MTLNLSEPSFSVLEDFGARGFPTALSGGRGASWRVGALVMKPLDMPVEALEWLSEEIGPLAELGSVRMAPPIRSRSGRLIVDGWTAFPLLKGNHEPGRWLDIIAGGVAFSRLTRDVPEPAFIQARDDAWARADRAAWGEETIEGLAEVPHIASLQDALRPVTEDSQRIHGDLTGNVLFHPDQPPAVIDLSLYWRPLSYASAIVVADALSFEQAPDTLLAAAKTTPDFLQCLARALIFRIATDHLLGNTAALGTAFDPFLRTIKTLNRHAPFQRPTST